MACTTRAGKRVFAPSSRRRPRCVRTARRERSFMNRKVDVLEGNVENARKQTRRSHNGIILFQAPDPISRAAHTRGSALHKNKLWERARIPFVGNVNVGAFPPRLVNTFS